MCFRNVIENELKIIPDVKLVDSLTPINENGRVSLIIFREYLETYGKIYQISFYYIYKGGFSDASTEAYTHFQRLLLGTSLDAT